MVQAFGRLERHPMSDVIDTFVSPTSFAELRGINHLLLSQRCIPRAPDPHYGDGDVPNVGGKHKGDISAIVTQSCGEASRPSEISLPVWDLLRKSGSCPNSLKSLTLISHSAEPRK